MMRKVFFVLFVLSVMAVGFFLGTMSNNKAYALFGGGSDDCLNCDAPELTKPPLRDEKIRQWNADLIKENYKLRQELEIYKVMENETFQAMEELKAKRYLDWKQAENLCTRDYCFQHDLLALSHEELVARAATSW